MKIITEFWNILYTYYFLSIVKKGTRGVKNDVFGFCGTFIFSPNYMIGTPKFRIFISSPIFELN